MVGVPNVIDGLRAPELPERKDEGSARAQAMSRATKRVGLAPEKAKRATEKAPVEGVHRFISHIKALKVTKRITLPKTAADGTLIPEVHDFAQFQAGYFETRDPEMAAFLRGWKTFGIEYSDADQVADEAQAKADQDFLDSVAARPDLQEKLRVMLGSKDFKLDDSEGTGGPAAGGGAPSE